ncbi:hypothetical protein AOLI_G00182030 [Acnodon oligacanthus]
MGTKPHLMDLSRACQPHVYLMLHLHIGVAMFMRSLIGAPSQWPFINNEMSFSNERGSSPSTNVLQDCCEPSLPSQLSHSLQSSTIHKSHVSNLACKYQTIVNSQLRTEVRTPLVLQREQSLKIPPQRHG